MNREPLVTVATITAGVTTILGLLVAFGVSFTGDQEKAILGVAAVAAPLIVAFFARPKVTPVTDPEPLHRDEVGQSALVLVLAVVGVVLLVLLLVGTLGR